MKSLKSKVVLSAIVLVFALVATIGSTYAWFTVSNTVAVEPMQLDVQSSESLLIRVFNGEDIDDVVATAGGLLDATSYKASISTADILLATVANYDELASWTMSPVTATTTFASGVSNGKALLNMAVSNANVARAYTDTATSNAAGANFVELKFWLLSQGTASENIVLEDLLITTVGANSEAQDAVVNAVRIAVWKSLEYVPGAPGTLEDPVEAALIYGLDNDYGFAFTTGMTGFDSVTASNNFIENTPTTGDQDLLEVAHAAYRSSTLTPDVANVHVDTLAEADTITALTSNTPALITVRIYMEGWDAQCTNAILAAAFNISFKFTIKNA